MHLVSLVFALVPLCAYTAPASPNPLAGKSVVFIARAQYPRDHHNTATIFQKGEINQGNFSHMQKFGSAIFKLNFDKNGNAQNLTKLLDCPEGVVRDLEVSYDAKKLLFARRENFDSNYRICELDLRSGKVTEITNHESASDIDPIYLPDGDILFVSTRDVKFCACNRHIMGNLFRTKKGQVTQVGKSKEFEHNPAMLPDGRIIYTRWEYTDKNFGGSQGLWTGYPDGTKHAIFCWQETCNPIVDACPIPDGRVAAIICATHGRPHGALAIFNISKSIEGADIVELLIPQESRIQIDKHMDSFEHAMMSAAPKFEDPSVLDKNHLLVSREIESRNEKTGLYVVNIKSGELTKAFELEEPRGIYDAKLLSPSKLPHRLPEQRSYSGAKTTAYISNVYAGTHMSGIEKGDIKYVRVLENPPKYYWSDGAWEGQGQQAPAMNYDDFDPKIEIGIAAVDEIGQAIFEIPTDKFLFLQLLDKDKQMLQTMRSGFTAMPGEIISCIGCHESRVDVTKVPPPNYRKTPAKLDKTLPDEEPFSYGKLIQPIFDAKCVNCHDYGKEGAKALVLAGDRGIVFNKSYTQLHSKKYLSVINAGPDAIQEPNKWGAKHSKLVKILEAGHHDVKLADKEMEILKLWIDMNAPYYETDTSVYGNNPGGRSPLTLAELKEIGDFLKPLDKTFITGGIINVRHYRDEIVSFDRPEHSEILSFFKNDSQEYSQILKIIKIGAQRLKENPREDMTGYKISERDMKNKKRAEDFKKEEDAARKIIGKSKMLSY